MEKSLIRHALDVDVDGLRGMTRYTVKAMYDGEVTVSNDISAMPTTEITVNFAGNIK